ncbi:hypothetical protein WCLP8_3150002 [uncultured Gammaproteobacteria bacterium]
MTSTSSRLAHVVVLAVVLTVILVTMMHAAVAQPRAQLPGDRAPGGELVLQLDDDGDDDFELMTRRQTRIMDYAHNYTRMVTLGMLGGAVVANLSFGGMLPTVAGLVGGGLAASWIALHTGPVDLNGALTMHAGLHGQ